MRGLAAQVLDRALELGELDFVEEVSRELPIRMLCRILGVPEADAGALVEWGDALISNADPEFSMAVIDQEDTEAFRLLPFRSPAARSVFDYASRIRKERLRRPTDDIISGMLAEDAGGRPLTELEFQNFFLLLIVAGNETTRHTISLGLLGLLDHPGAWKALDAAPGERGLFESATEEILRWTSVTMHFRRTLTRDLDLDGAPTAPGRQGRPLVHRREPRSGCLSGARAVRRPPEPEPAPGVRRRPARLPGRLARAPRGPGHLRGTLPPGASCRAHRPAGPSPFQLHPRDQAPAGAVEPQVGSPPMRRIAILLWLAVFGASGAEAQFTLEQVFSAPFPTSLTASSDGSRVAWVFDERGARNVWAADAPGFEGRRLTSFEGDDGTTIHSLAFSRDGRKIVFIRGDGPNRAGELPNPTSNPAGVEQALWVIDQGGEPRRISEPAASPLFTADGDAVLFVRRGRIWKVGLDADAEPEQLIHGRGSFGNLRLSPGGGRLAFVSSRGAHSFVGVYDFGAKTVHYLDPAVDRDGSPAFSPDGSEVAFLRTPPALERYLFVPSRDGPPWSIRVASLANPATSREVFRAEPGMGSVFSGTASAGPTALDE